MNPKSDSTHAFEPSPEYLAREKRVMDVVALKKPDRVPVATFAHSFMTRCEGLTEAQSLYDFDKTREAYKATTRRFDFDMAPPILTRLPGKAMALMGLNTFKWPGFNQDDDIPYQFVEAEHMRAEEYDAFLQDPGDFTVRKMWPRLAKIFEPLAMFPPLYSATSGYNTWTHLGLFAGMPAFQKMLKTMLAVGEEMNRYMAFQTRTITELARMGYPTLCTAVSHAPFDWLSDYFRGLKGTMFDMYRMPDKMKAATERLLPMLVEGGIIQARMSGNPRVFIPLHRGSDAFMSDAMFKEFYWPGLKSLLLAIIDAGLTPMPWFEGKYTDRLKYLAELPPGKVMGHFDIVDKKKFKEICGDVMCFYGDIPPSLLITGNPQQVKDYVKGLIDMFGDTGTLIIDGAVEGIPVQARPENVEAMMQTVSEHGIY
ncbi:MAG: hypothetical protein HKP58_20170 [Desulfatitalea sp.]|nr:hypothetical protein [Desulfatitalea sp.]NNK02734.1 hypothetical protein [Desulfatitalea sp.]